jgi:Ca-activated chloride channel family protein
MSHAVGLESTGGEPVALKSVALEGHLDGLFLRMAITQEYRNETGRNLEIVYTFPLAFGAILTKMEVTLGEKTMQACVIEKREAAERYEKAIDEGDTPILLEASSAGLYTANLGNVLDGEKLKLTIHYAQLLHFEQGRVRLHVPTVIAPRYGDAHREGGLALHESDAVDLLADYALHARIELAGDIARGKVGSPSHAIDTQVTENGLAVLLRSGATLDRDFVLTLSDLPGASFAVVAPDHDEQVVLATFCPELPERADPIALKILVDCSGSMEGDSMRQAQMALQGIAGRLDAKDYISYSRFGNACQHVLSTLCPYEDEMRLAFSRAVRHTQANMGGTEMAAALLSTLQDIVAPDAAPPANLLLITDGDIWNVDGVIQAALAGGQRIFAVGVSSSPAESLLRKLAEATGGACELVSPGEDMAAAITRVFCRMRGARAGKPHLVWDGEPLWQSRLPKALYSKETLHVFARFAQAPRSAPRLCWEVAAQTFEARAERLETVENRELARLGGARQMQTANPKEALALALKYQLVSAQTNLFLVHVREGEKATDLPMLHQVPQMLAAGWGGLSLVGAAFCCYMPSMSASDLFSREIAEKLIHALNTAAKTQTEWAKVLSSALAQIDATTLKPLNKRIRALAKSEGLPFETVWAIAAGFLEAQNEKLSPQVTRLMQAQSQGVDARKVKAVKAVLQDIIKHWRSRAYDIPSFLRKYAN